MKKIGAILVLLFAVSTLSAQYRLGDSFLIPGRVINGDTVLHINMREIIIFPPRKFKSRRQRRRYTRLVRYVKKVYPYSQIIKKKFTEINQALDTLESKKERKIYLKEAEKDLKRQFEGKLKKLTIKQGRILMKLVDRETGSTTYEVVKQLKGSFTVFFWQSLASLFGSSMKKEYDKDGEDKMIEEIIVLIENGQL